MALSDEARDELLSAWIEPSSDTEQSRQDRAERLIREAVKAHSAFAGVNLSVYAKGSYANNTNVALDSDVDIVVQCNDCFYYDYADGVVPPPASLPPYEGEWTASAWRAEVTAALRRYFGTSEVDATGKVAIAIAERKSSRPNADVVPAFDYCLYWTSNRTRSTKGSIVHTHDLRRIINWPEQQLANGREKNNRTGRRYKRFVRALKHAENRLREINALGEKPSYLMECLVYNVSDVTLQSGRTLADGFKATLEELWRGLRGSEHETWREPNELKLLFHPSQKWNVQDAREVVACTWEHLYG